MFHYHDLCGLTAKGVAKWGEWGERLQQAIVNRKFATGNRKLAIR